MELGKAWHEPTSEKALEDDGKVQSPAEGDVFCEPMHAQENDGKGKIGKG